MEKIVEKFNGAATLKDLVKNFPGIDVGHLKHVNLSSLPPLEFDP